MNDKDLFEEENSDDKRERNLRNENQLEEQCKEYLKPFEDILNQIDEGVDNLDSYERTMQVKRSIDRLIKTLYSQAPSEDIDTELETTKNTRDKTESKKRVMEKRKEQVREEVLSVQQQKELMNSRQKHEAAGDGDIQKAKIRMKECYFQLLVTEWIQEGGQGRLLMITKSKLVYTVGKQLVELQEHY